MRKGRRAEAKACGGEGMRRGTVFQSESDSLSAAAFFFASFSSSVSSGFFAFFACFFAFVRLTPWCVHAGCG